MTVVFNSRQETEVHKMNDRKNKNKMTDRFSLGQFTVDENDTAPNQHWWTLTTGQVSSNGQLYCIRTVTTDQKEKSPRFAFLKISATAHCTHLQSRASQHTTQALQKSAILPALNQPILHIEHMRLKNN